MSEPSSQSKSSRPAASQPSDAAPNEPAENQSGPPPAQEPPHDGPQPAAAADPADAGAEPAAEPESRDEEMSRLRSEVDAANRRVLQAQADAENFRKRTRRDYEDQLKYAAMPLVSDLLQVRDNLTRALEATADLQEAQGVSEGVAMVAKQLDDTLTKHGVKEIPAEGELFDPNYHEAVSQMPSAEHPSGTVSYVAVPGFQMHERVIRPSQVVVSTGPPE